MGKVSGPVQRERDRIAALHRQAAIEVTKLILVSGMPSPTKREREKQRWTIEGFKHATDALQAAIQDGRTPA